MTMSGLGRRRVTEAFLPWALWSFVPTITVHPRPRPLLPPVVCGLWSVGISPMRHVMYVRLTPLRLCVCVPPSFLPTVCVFSLGRPLHSLNPLSLNRASHWLDECTKLD